MTTISVSEFRSNIKKYCDIAISEKVIIHRNGGKSFAIIPVDELHEKPYNQAFVNKILQSREDSKNGLGVKIDIDDLWK